jgi:hypothetical protein
VQLTGAVVLGAAREHATAVLTDDLRLRRKA